MSDINTANQTSDALSQYALQQKSANRKNELGKNEFMDLMIAQLNNQSPLDPQDNTAFVAQLAQFSSVEGIQSLNSTVDTMASQFRSAQALQASAMVGRDVLAPMESAIKSADGSINGVVELPAGTSQLTISVYNEAGELITNIDKGYQPGGDVKFSWDGKNSNGETLPAGRYEVVARARYSGEQMQVSSYLAANVDSVSIARDGGVTLNLAGLGSVGLSDIKQIS
ncbi:Flagellar hook capping protein [Hahella chejuensis KCTC 2396]|uniref:Basal-body rod modification protein FlgD n=1 Tax=Hahella chejuensis (strain KCTC 2396) TaxID=349521 RepID=Q2SDU0_HAHCH|nr:flagellar hook assembly protein FlgD [Hahella chejuensis]ABC31184.1 Flagellar hook capping protein [Hahella chejuensis KCTC 2396]